MLLEKVTSHPVTVGKVENYYSKSKVALVKVSKEIDKNVTIGFEGRTTKEFTQPISEIRDYDGNEIICAKPRMQITIPVTSKMRKNDIMVLVH